MRKLMAAAAVAALALAALPCRAQEVMLKSGEAVDLFPVYWVVDCKSALKSFAGVDIFSGPPELRAELQEGDVPARRQGCPEKVPGATLRLRAGDVKAAFDGTVRIRVRYLTTDGDKQSVHNVKVTLVP